MAVIYSRHAGCSPSIICSFRFYIDGPGLGLLANADLQISSRDLVITGPLPYQHTACQQPQYFLDCIESLNTDDRLYRRAAIMLRFNACNCCDLQGLL